MGRYAKNAKISSRSYAIGVPVGTNSIGPGFPEDGQVRYNTSESNFEVYSNGAWKGMALAGSVTIVKDSFVGNGSTFSFTLTKTYQAGHEAEMLVFIGNVFQNPGVAYTVSGYTISFTSVPDTGVPIVVLHNFNSTHVQ